MWGIPERTKYDRHDGFGLYVGGGALLLLLVACAIFTAGGARAVQSPEIVLPPPLAKEFRIAERFPGPDGMIGLVLEDGSGKKAVAWATPGGKAIVIGEVIDGKGVALTREAMDARGIRPAGPPLPEKEIEEFRKSLREAMANRISPGALYGQAVALTGKVALFPEIG